MTNLRDVLIRPLITEKTNDGMQDNKYTFVVPLNATKVAVRQAVESIFKVKVVDVNTIRVKVKLNEWVSMRANAQISKKPSLRLLQDNVSNSLRESKPSGG